MRTPTVPRFFRSIFLAAFSCLCITSERSAAEKTNELKTNEVQAAAEAEIEQNRRTFLQLQEQLHATRLAIEQTREEAGEAAKRNAETITTRLKLIEQALTLQREREMEAMQKSNRLMLMGGGIFGGVGVLALVFTAWFLLRAMNRLSDIAATFPMGHALAPPPAAAALGGGETHLVGFGSPEPPGRRLLGAIERLEKRIHDLEHTSQASPTAGEHQPEGEGESHRVDSEKAEKISLMLGKGQALLHMDQPDNALGCFEEVLSLEPNHAEALIKKGTALERLKRLEEAIECYDRAIAANNSMTLAYLYKGGVFNQLERFSEALQCYEQALRSQQKATVS